MDEESSEIKSITGSGSFRFGDYRSLGTHGMMALGTVMGHGRRWFVKSLTPRYSDLSEARAMLAKEYDIMLSLRHEAIVRPIAFEELPGIGMSIIMDYVDGVTLSEYAATASLRQRRAVAEALVDAVAFLHRNGLTHSDLKPDNILVGGTVEHPRVTLIDFNLSDAAVYTDAKAVGGNRKYASPEQFCVGYVSSPRSDVWSLGVLLRELRLGPVWKPAIMLAMRVNPEQRLPDASAIALVRRRTKNVLIAIYTILIVSALSVAIYLIPPERQETEANPKTELPPVATPEIISSSPTPTSEHLPAPSSAGQGRAVSQNSVPEVEQLPVKNEEEAKYDLLISNVSSEIEKLRGEIRTFMANENLTREELWTKYIEFSKKFSEIALMFGKFQMNLSDEVKSRHSEQWGTPYDPAISKQYSALKQDLSGIMQRCDELKRQYVRKS